MSPKRKRIDTTAVSAAANTINLADKYKRSVEPVAYEKIPDSVKRLARMQDFPQKLEVTFGGNQPREYRQRVKEMKDRFFTDHLKREELGDYDIFYDEVRNEVVFSFGHFNPDISKKGLKDILANNAESQNALVLRNIPADDVENIEAHPYFSENVKNRLADDLLKMRTVYPRSKITFAGYSKGGYLAKYWGSKFGIDQDLLNAHVFPYNTFEPTTATTRFHTIATDETNFKYVLPNVASSDRKEEHYIYPSVEENPDFDITTGDVWGNHRLENFNPELFYDTQTPEIQRMYEMPRGSTIAPKLGTAGAVLGVADIGVDIAQGQGESAAIKGAMLTSSILNPAVGMAEGAAMMSFDGIGELKSGEIGTGYRHTVEGFAMGASIAGGGLSMAAIGEGVGAVEDFVQMADDIKNKNKGQAAVHGIEASLLTMGAASTFVPGVGILGAVGFGVLAGAVDLTDRLVEWAKTKKTVDRTGLTPTYGQTYAEDDVTQKPPKMQSFSSLNEDDTAFGKTERNVDTDTTKSSGVRIGLNTNKPIGLNSTKPSGL